MTTITSVGSGAWSDAGTWDSGVPVDGDDVVIASDHTVTFDVDQSAFTTGVKVTITGTLTHTTAAGTYVLKAKTGASIVGAGTWNIGTSDTPIPFAAKHTITGAAGWYVDGVAGLAMTVYGAEPSIKTIKLSGDEAAGQTELSVDTDVTGDIWADGDIIRISGDVMSNTAYEERTIAAGGVGPSTITITAGLSSAKAIGEYIILMTRNIQILPNAPVNYVLYRLTNATVNSGWFKLSVNKRMFENCNSLTITGGVFSGCYYAINSASTNVIVENGVFIGNGSSASGTPLVIKGGTFIANNDAAFANNAVITGGVFHRNRDIFYGAISPLISGGTFTVNKYIFNEDCFNILVMGGSFSGNSTFMARTHGGTLYNISLGSTNEHINYTNIRAPHISVQSFNHGGVDGALKAWCKGGVVTSQTTVKPTGYTQAYLLDPESATYPVFFTKTFSVEPGKTVGVEVQLRKDASMTYLPRVYLMASIGNPLAGATAVDSFTMTDSTDTWETDTFTIVNSTDYDQDYTLWFVAQNASGNAYSAYKITTQGGSGGAVRILPIGGSL